MYNPIKKFTDQIQSMKASGTLKRYRVVSSPQDTWFTVDGQRVLNLCSNNYLGLASHPQVRKAAIEAIEKYGVGTGAVRALSGNSVLHEELEKSLAEFKKTEAVMVVQSGFIANIIAIQTLLDKEDIVISDELNHASIIDAVKIAQVQTKFIYPHNDVQGLEEKLKEAVFIRDKEKRSDSTDKTILIITDGVFSMDGDIAPLPDIVDLAKKYGALTMVDDAHGEGVLGDKGRGIVDHFHLHGQVDIEVGTLSKALGVIGGCLSGKEDLIEFYKQKARPFAFSTGLSIPDTAALIESVRIMNSGDLVEKLWSNAKYLKGELKKIGFNTGESATPITPVMIGDEQAAKDFSNALFLESVFATPILFPMVAKGKARIRVMPSAAHSTEDLNFGIKAFAKVGKTMGLVN